MVNKPIKGAGAVQLLLFCMGAFILYFPILGRTFASDDFEVMRRVGMGDFRTPGFFRPLSDLSLYLNYLLGGFRPAGYYILNILIHGVNSWLVYLFCRKWRWTDDQGRQRGYALVAALLFLCYPFHNEGIVWILGRGASLSTMFGLATLVVLLNSGSVEYAEAGVEREGRMGRGQRMRLARFQRGKTIWGAIFYFIGMMAYEPVILLPVMCYILLSVREGGRREKIRWGVALGSALMLHLVLRVVFSGGVFGEYERDFFGSAWRRYAGNAGKVTARMLLPPTDHTRGLLAAALGLLGVFVVAIVFFFRRTRRARVAGVDRGDQRDWIDRLDRMDRRRQRRYLRALFLLWCVAAIVPVVSAVSTRTSESDRLLYLPSVFVCCILSYLLVQLLRERRWVVVASALLLFYMIFFLEKNNRNWVRASDITRDILTVTGGQPSGVKIFVVGLPDELDGAYIFRLGFPQALLMGGRDTTGLVIVSHLTREQWQTDSIRIEPLGGGDTASAAGMAGGAGGAAGAGGVDGGAVGGGLLISPGTTIRRRGGDSVQIENAGRSWLAGKGDRVLYWNKKRLVELGLFF